MAINTAAGSRIFIGPVTTADDVTAYAALAWTEIGEVEDLGEFGDQSNSVTFTALANARVRKMKGTKDAGDLTLTVGFDAGDAGQLALIAAEADSSPDDYGIKVQLNDSAATPTVAYFRGKVMSYRLQPGNADNVVRASVSVGINSAVIIN